MQHKCISVLCFHGNSNTIHVCIMCVGVSSPWLVLEFLSNGDLKSFLKVRTQLCVNICDDALGVLL